jgi:hypothetical protein
MRRISNLSKTCHASFRAPICNAASLTTSTPKIRNRSYVKLKGFLVALDLISPGMYPPIAARLRRVGCAGESATARLSSQGLDTIAAKSHAERSWTTISFLATAYRS